MRLADHSDVELLDRTRAGHADAFAELWIRHWQPVLAAAHRYRSLGDPEDLVQEAFLRVHQSLLGGGGPFHSFRPYLYRTVRNIAISMGRATHAEPVGAITDLVDRLGAEGDAEDDLSAQVLDRSITVRAFNQLPSRWQEALWYTVVEGLKPREVAPLLGLSPNAVSALVVRAREGLRQEWLRAHTRSDGIPAECRTIVDQVPALARGALPKRRRDEVRAHLDSCLHCSLISEEIDDLASSLRTVLPPLLLLPVGGALTLFGELRPEAVAGAVAAPEHSSVLRRGHRASNPGRSLTWSVPEAAKIAGVVSGIVLVLLGGRAMLTPSPQEPSQLSAEPAEPSGVPESPSQEVVPEPAPEPAPEPEPAPVPEDEWGRTPTGGTNPRDAQTTGAAQTHDADDAGDADDAAEADPDEGQVADDAAGPLLITGPEAGSYTLVPEITGVGTPGSEVTLLDRSGASLGLTTVAADGSWAITPTGLEAGTVEFVAVTDGSVSKPLGPYTLLAPDLEVAAFDPDLPVTETATGGSLSGTAGGRIRGISGQAARIEFDGARMSPWYRFGSRAFTVHFTNVPSGQHTLTARYVDPATGRVGAARALTVTVSGPGTGT